MILRKLGFRNTSRFRMGLLFPMWTFSVWFHLVLAQTNTIIPNMLTVSFSPDSAVQYDGRSSMPLDIINGPHGRGVVIGDNGEDAVFLPSQSL